MKKILNTRLTGSKLPSIILGLKSGGLQLLSNVQDEQQEVELALKIAVFPNPIQQSNLLRLISNQEVVIELIDIWGHTFSDRITLNKGELKELDLFALRSGLYMIRAESVSGKKSSVKFVVTN